MHIKVHSENALYLRSVQSDLGICGPVCHCRSNSLFSISFNFNFFLLNPSVPSAFYYFQHYRNWQAHVTRMLYHISISVFPCIPSTIHPVMFWIFALVGIWIWMCTLKFVDWSTKVKTLKRWWWKNVTDWHPLWNWIKQFLKMQHN